jgi:hypothetical protein
MVLSSLMLAASSGWRSKRNLRTVGHALKAQGQATGGFGVRLSQTNRWTRATAAPARCRA